MINNRFNVVYHLLYLVKKLFYKLKNINMEEVNYKWVIGKGWVVYSNVFEIFWDVV